MKFANLLKEEKGPVNLPDGFKPAKKVPEGGAMCANCSKWNRKEQLCEGKFYIAWNGDGKIPEEVGPTKYVCIWWVPKNK